MAPLLSTMLFAATATAQVTTSFWRPTYGLGTENVGFVGSVIDADGTHTTLVADYDNGTDTSALGLVGGPQTYTIGPRVFGTTVETLGPGPENAQQVNCVWPTPGEADSSLTCSLSYGPEIASFLFCEASTYSWSETVETKTHTYPARGSQPAGTETVTQTASVPVGSAFEVSSRPSFCSASDELVESYVTSYSDPASVVSTFYLVLTAGLDKLEATAAATPTMSSAMSTGTGDATATSGSAMLPEVTEAGAPMLTGAPMLLGLGAAAAALLV